MILTISNIGIIGYSNVELNGLTIITGKNNSGKTTIGKCLYSILEGSHDVGRYASRDRERFTRDRMFSMLVGVDSFSYLEKMDIEKILSEPECSKCPLFISLLCSILGYDDSVTFDFSIDNLERLLVELKSVDYFLLRTELKKVLNSRRKIKEEDVSREKEYLIREIKSIISILKKNMEISSYEKTRVNQLLISEFSNQIQPVRVAVKESSISLQDKDDQRYAVDIENNQVSKLIKSDSSENYDAYMIDNAHLLDSDKAMRNPPRYMSLRWRNLDFDKWISHQSSVCSHQEKILNSIWEKRGNVFEQTVLSSEYDILLKKLNKVVPGEFDSDSEGHYYRDGNMKLNVDNLATGSKLFSIIKLLMKNGKITRDTVLIFDEPEAHLHPEWQNSFAELIVCIVKEIGTTVLLTTHSPNLTLAFDANMRKYEINDKVCFYQMESIKESGLSECKKVNDDLGVIYDDFVSYLAEMKALRDKYIEGKFED